MSIRYCGAILVYPDIVKGYSMWKEGFGVSFLLLSLEYRYRWIVSGFYLGYR